MLRAASLTMVCALALACADRAPDPTGPIDVPLFLHGAAGGSDMANGGNFGTPLSGDEEVPARDTRARGNAIFQLSDDGMSLDYKLIAANIENVIMAHIHLAPAGSNGGIVVWLYPSTAPGVQEPPGQGRIDGVIAQGTITAADLVGALAGQPLSALIDQLTSGGAYVNVHTNDGVGGANSGPGDFPGGEIRGQIEHRGH